MRASAESVDRKRFIVSSAESGGSGGGREEEEERVTHAGELQQLTLQPVLRSPNLLSVGCLNSHLSEAAGARVCSKMAVVFYLTGNFLLIGLLPQFDSVPF